MVAEQALGGLVQRQDAAGQIERDGAVARAVEHGLKVAARQTAGGRRFVLGDAQSRAQFRFQRAAQRDQRRRRAVPGDHLRVAVDGQDLPVRPHDRNRADVFSRHRSRIAVAEHHGEGIRRLKLCEITIADELEQRPIGVERLPVAGDERADRKTVQNRAGVAPNLIAVGAARRPQRRLAGPSAAPRLYRFELPVGCQRLPVRPRNRRAKPARGRPGRARFRGTRRARCG